MRFKNVKNNSFNYTIFDTKIRFRFISQLKDSWINITCPKSVLLGTTIQCVVNVTTLSPKFNITIDTYFDSAIQSYERPNSYYAQNHSNRYNITQILGSQIIYYNATTNTNINSSYPTSGFYQRISATFIEILATTYRDVLVYKGEKSY